MTYQEFTATLKVGDTLTITENPQHWPLFMFLGKRLNNDIPTIPYTFRIDTIFSSDIAIFIDDANGYRWTINKYTLPFFKKENNRSERIKNLKI